MFRTRLHLLFLLSGVGIAVLLGIHMVVQHLNIILATGDTDPNSWISMIGRSTQWGWVVIYLLLLAFGIYHGLYGLRNIIFELTASERTERYINWAFIIGGLVVFGGASYVPIVLATGWK
jgi:succinate dehydrogenase hydrophobic anchor subunit